MKTFEITEQQLIEEIRKAYRHGQSNEEMMQAGLERNEIDDYTNFRIIQVSKMFKIIKED